MNFFSKLFRKSQPDPAQPAKSHGDTSPAENWSPGEVVLDNLEIIRVISGAMGHVFITNHLGWQIKMAVKTPRPEVLSNSEGRRRIKKEAEAWIKMGMHPHIATCFYVLSLKEIPLIFIEYVNGGSLDEWIKAGRCRDLRTSLSMAIQFCHGMEYTHSKGIIHRDIKPQNILMTREGLVKITDFGILLNTREPLDLTEEQPESQPAVRQDVTEGFRGTPGFASPEQFRSSHQVDERSDIFSFGLCLWLMLCGKKPFERNDIELPIPAPRPQPGANRFPAILKETLTSLVAHEPEERLPDFKQLRERLNQAHLSAFGVPCPCYSLTELDLRAENLNNHAVSLHELQHDSQALKVLNRALDINDNLPEAIHNLALLKWLNNQTSPANLITQLKSAAARLNKGDLLLPLADRIKNRAETEGKAELPGLKLCSPPISLNVYREGQINHAVRANIEGLYRGGQLQECFATLMTSWKSRYYIRDPFFIKVYRALIKSGRKKQPLAAIRINRLNGSDRPIRALACLPKAKAIFLTDSEGHLWKLGLHRQHREKIRLDREGGKPDRLIADNERQRLFLGTDKGIVLRFSARGERGIKLLQFNSPIQSLAVNPAGTLLAAADHLGEIKIFDLQKNTISHQKRFDDSFSSLLFCDISGRLICGSSTGRVHLLSLAPFEVAQIIDAHQSCLSSLHKIAPAGRFLSAGDDGKARIYETSSGMLLKSFSIGHKSPQTSLGSTDGRLLITNNGDDLINLIQIKKGRNIYELDSRSDGVTTMALGPLPHIFLAGSRDGTILICMVLYDLSFD